MIADTNNNMYIPPPSQPLPIKLMPDLLPCDTCRIPYSGVLSAGTLT